MIRILGSIASHEVPYIGHSHLMTICCLPSRLIIRLVHTFQYSMFQEVSIEQPHLPTLLSLPQTHAANAIKFSGAYRELYHPYRSSEPGIYRKYFISGRCPHNSASSTIYYRFLLCMQFPSLSTTHNRVQHALKKRGKPMEQGSCGE